MEEENYIFVIAGGSFGNPEFFRTQIASFHPVRLICADGGARHLEALGIAPHIIIGDMDSLDLAPLKHYEEQGVEIIRHPPRKDETDTQLALNVAWQSRPREVRVYGGLGGRIDHTLANISLLMESAKRKIATRLVDEWCEIFVITGQTTLTGGAGQTVSLFPLTTQVTGIDLEGFAYPLIRGTMEIGAPYGISNQLLADRAAISVGEGALLVVKYHRPDHFPEAP